MGYLQDKARKNRKIRWIVISVLLLAVLFYFRTPVGRGLNSFGAFIFSPVASVGQNTGGFFSNLINGFKNKNALVAENETLKTQLYATSLENLNYQVVVDENLKLKEILGRKSSGTYILGNILAKPYVSAYDTLIIDIGEVNGVAVGDLVFALGNIPIGKIASVQNATSKVLLFSSPKEKVNVIISGTDTYVDLIGRGGGNFEIILPRDMTLETQTQVLLPGGMPYTLAILESTINDPRDAYQKALLKSPVNIQAIKFVQVRKQ